MKCGWVQLVSEKRTELRGTLKSAEFQYLLHLFTENTKRPVLEGAFKSKTSFLSVLDNSLPTGRRLILQQWVIKESTGRWGLS